MSGASYHGNRLRAYLEFLAGILFYFLARSFAVHGATGLANGAYEPLIEQAMLVFLLIVAYAAFGFWIDRQLDPIGEQGLNRRAGSLKEFGMGAAVGWSIALACVLPMTVMGGIAVAFSAQLSAWGWLAADLAFFALLALAEEVAFRGYAFQRFENAVGSAGATLGFAAIYAIVQALTPGANHASVAVSVVFTILLSTAYLRTRALWVSWGINFAWKASRAVVFGLAVNGVSTHSPIVQGDPMGPFWLSGGAFGLEGSWLTFFVMIAAIPVVVRVTRELNFKYNAPVLIPGGIPVDLDAAARAQHEAAMGEAAPAAPALVQIGSAPPPAGGENSFPGPSRQS